MKKPLLALAALCALAFFSPAHARPALPATEPFTKSVPFDADGKLTVSSISGSVEIRTWDKNELRLEGERRAQTTDDLNLIGVVLDTSPSRVTVKIDRHSLPPAAGAEAHLVITLPVTAGIDRVSVAGKNLALPGGKVSPGSSVKIEVIDGRVSTVVHGTFVSDGLPKGFGWLRKIF